MLVGVLVAVAASVFPIGKLEEMVNVGTLFAFVLVSAGVIMLRRTRPDLKRGFRVPLVPWLPIAAIVACVWLMLNLTALTWIRFLIWMAIGDRRLLAVRPQPLGAGPRAGRREFGVMCCGRALRPAQLTTPKSRQVEPLGCGEHLLGVLNDCLRRQDGVLTLADARRCGIDRHAVHRRVRAGTGGSALAVCISSTTALSPTPRASARPCGVTARRAAASGSRSGVLARADEVPARYCRGDGASGQQRPQACRFACPATRSARCRRRRGARPTSYRATADRCRSRGATTRRRQADGLGLTT